MFTEQGSSASQMTAAKIMDIISRLPGCAGQAADAVSAYTYQRMEDAPKVVKIQKLECPDIWIRLPHKWPKSWSSIEDPVVPLERFGSKKWRGLNQWMISNLRVLSEELLVLTLSYLTRELLQN